MGRATSHSNSDFCTIVTGELAAIPRGHFYQNMYRMVYEQARLNGLGRQALSLPVQPLQPSISPFERSATTSPTSSRCRSASAVHHVRPARLF